MRLTLCSFHVAPEVFRYIFDGDFHARHTLTSLLQCWALDLTFCHHLVLFLLTIAARGFSFGKIQRELGERSN